MKLLRFGGPGKEHPGVLVNDKITDVSDFGEDFGESFFESGGVARLRKWFDQNARNLPVAAGNQRIGSPLLRPSKIICIGLNYADHAKESNMEIPKEPVIFFKSTTALCGPNDNLV